MPKLKSLKSLKSKKLSAELGSELEFEEPDVALKAPESEESESESDAEPEVVFELDESDAEPDVVLEFEEPDVALKASESEESESESESDAEPEVVFELDESDAEPEVVFELDESDAEPEVVFELDESDAEPELAVPLSVQTPPQVPEEKAGEIFASPLQEPEEIFPVQVLAASRSTFVGSLYTGAYNSAAYVVNSAKVAGSYTVSAVSSTAYASMELCFADLHTEMSRTVFTVASDFLVKNNAVFSASQETKHSILVQRDSGDIAINPGNLTRTTAGYLANQGSSYAAARAVALAYQHIVGNVELQAEYELGCKLVETFTKTLPADFVLLQESLVHVVGAIPVDFMSAVVSPMMTECVRNTPLGVLFDKLSGDKSTTILKSLFNVPAQAGQMLQCKTKGQYRGLINKAIDTLKAPGLGSMQDADSIANLYQAYIKLSIVIPRFQAHYAFLNEAYHHQLKPALNKVRDAALNGPAAESFAKWWEQPSEPPQCIQDAMLLCQSMIGLCAQKSNEMIPYLQAGRQGMFEVINPDCLAKQLVCATVNIGIHQAKQQSGQAVQFCANTLIDNCLNSAVYNGVVGPMSALTSGIAPAQWLNGGASMGIEPENVVKAMAVFDAPIKQSVISNVQDILKALDDKFTLSSFGKEEQKQFKNDMSKVGKCFALYSVGAFNGIAVFGVAPAAGTVMAGVAIASVTLPELLKHFTCATSEVMLHHTLNKASSAQIIDDIQAGLAKIIKLCLAPTPPVLMLENNAAAPAGQLVPVVPGALIPIQPQLDRARIFGQKMGTQINQKLPEGLNTFGKNMGISGNIADKIMYPQSATEKMTSMVNATFSPFLNHANKGKGKEKRLNRILR